MGFSKGPFYKRPFRYDPSVYTRRAATVGVVITTGLICLGIGFCIYELASISINWS